MKGGEIMKVVKLIWRPKNIVSMAHPGCCAQNGGCTKKHG